MLLTLEENWHQVRQGTQMKKINGIVYRMHTNAAPLLNIGQDNLKSPVFGFFLE